jgi:hypothetical protein
MQGGLGGSTTNPNAGSGGGGGGGAFGGGGGGGGGAGSSTGGGGGGGSGLVKAGATGINQTSGNTTPSRNGEVDITSSGGSGSCTAPISVVVEPAFTG